jgi:hypothetical protein
MPYKLPDLVPASPDGSPSGARKLTPLADSLAKKVEVTAVEFISGLDARIERYRQEHLRIHQRGREITKLLNAVGEKSEGGGPSPPASPLLVSMTNLQFPLAHSLPPAAMTSDNSQSVGANPPAIARSSTPISGRTSTEIAELAGKQQKSNLEKKIGIFEKKVILKKEMVKNRRKLLKAVQRGSSKPSSPRVPQTPVSSMAPQDAPAKETAPTPAEPSDAAKKEGEGDASDFTREKWILTRLQLPGNSEVLKEIKALDRESTLLLDAFEDISQLFALRTVVMAAGSQSRNLLDNCDQILTSVSEKVDQHRDMYGDYLRSRADMEKSLIKHPMSEAVFRRVLVHSIEMWDLLEDAYMNLTYDMSLLHGMFHKDLPVVAEVLKMEGHLGDLGGEGEGEE